MQTAPGPVRLHLRLRVLGLRQPLGGHSAHRQVLPHSHLRPTPPSGGISRGTGRNRKVGDGEGPGQGFVV